MADLPNPHDALFRALLCDPERARDFLRDHLPNNIAGLLADEPPQIMDGSFVDEALAGSQSDLLMKARLADGGDAFIFVLAEHKSKPDPGLPLQIARYTCRVWTRYAGDNARKLRSLPPILPVVIYHGKAGWNVPESLAEMIDAPDPDLVFLPGSGYILRNLRAMEIEELSSNAALRAGFVTLRREALGFLATIADALPEGGDLRRQVLEYILRVYDVEMDDLKAALRREGHTEMEALMGTIADALIKQGMAEGEARGMQAGEQLGLARGKAEGKAEGKADTLRTLLVRRFGPLPGHARALIDGASLAELDAWLDAVLDANSLEAVFDSGRV